MNRRQSAIAPPAGTMRSLQSLPLQTAAACVPDSKRGTALPFLLPCLVANQSFFRAFIGGGIAIVVVVIGGRLIIIHHRAQHPELLKFVFELPGRFPAG